METSVSRPNPRKTLRVLLKCLLRNLYAGQEATVRTGHTTTDWFQIGKRVGQGCIWSPCVFNLYAVYIMWNAGLDEAQARIKVARRNNNNLRYSDDTTLLAESEELNSFLIKVKEENEKVGLKLNIQKTKIMASGPITSWQIDGETVRDFIFLGSKITADGDSSHEIKRHLLLGRKAMTKLDSILKSRDITANKSPSRQMDGFSSSHVWMWELDYKESKHQKIDAFELWHWRRLLWVPWTARRSNQSIKGNQSWIFIGRTDAKAETPILWPPSVKNWLVGEDPDAGKDWRQEEKGMTEDEMVGWHHGLDGHSLSKL